MLSRAAMAGSFWGKIDAEINLQLICQRLQSEIAPEIDDFSTKNGTENAETDSKNYPKSLR